MLSLLTPNLQQKGARIFIQTPKNPNETLHVRLRGTSANLI